MLRFSTGHIYRALSIFLHPLERFMTAISLNHGIGLSATTGPSNFAPFHTPSEIRQRYESYDHVYRRRPATLLYVARTALHQHLRDYSNHTPPEAHLIPKRKQSCL